MSAMAERIAAIDWQAMAASLNEVSHAVAPLLTAAECTALATLYDDRECFRSKVVMARHGYGRGEYKYFAYPLPGLVLEIRTALYPPLARMANEWERKLNTGREWPGRHADLLEICGDAGQTRPTPLLLKYGAGDYNCLHQDLYGEIHFPLQATALLDAPGKDFDGGEFTLVEQRPRRQSRVEVVPLARGDIVIFPVRERPRDGRRGTYRTQLRHGVSSLRRGMRRTLGIIFHDAK